MVADQAANFTGGIAGDLITSHFIDNKLGIKNPVGKELAHTAISSGIGAGISGTAAGAARAGTLAYGQGGLENTAARFGEGFLETGAIAGAGTLAGGIAGDLSDMGVHAALRAAGMKEGAATSVANITGGAVGGGVGILALYLQEKTGFRAGFTQLLFDACIFAAAFFVIPAGAVFYSMLGALVVNLIITFNHRRDWYVAT